MRPIVRPVITTCVLIAALSVAGCGSTPVAGELEQREANQIVAVLRERGIESHVTRGRGANASCSVGVSTGDFGEAAAILTELGLPAERKVSFREMTASSGIIPSSREVEALRLDRAIASEIEKLLEARSDVRSASAMVRQRSVNGQGSPAVSIVVQRNGQPSLREEDIRALALRAVPGIRAEEIYVSVVDAPRVMVPDGGNSENDLVPFLRFWRVPSEQYYGLVSVIVGLLTFGGILAGFFGYLLGQFNVIRREASVVASRDDLVGRRINASADGEDEISDEEKT